jgi:hypothetical protein
MRRLALTASVFAGMAALPLTTASAAGSADLPSGSASASALSVKVSLLPLKSIGNGLAYAQLTGALSTLQKALCPTPTASNPTGCPLNLTIPTSLPDSLTVNVAQAEDNATLNAVATDITAGHSDSTPVASDWAALNANLSALQSFLTNLINTGTTDLATGNVNALTSLLNFNNGTLSINAPVLGTASFNLLGTVSASLPGNLHDTATAVQITGAQSQPTDGLNVTVDPFNACAVNAAQVSACKGASTAETAADNSVVKVNLPDLVGASLNISNLSNLAAELKSLINALTNTLANPSQAGSILNNVSGVPAPLQGTLSTLGTLLSTAGSTAGGTTQSLDLSALQLFDTKLAASLDSLNAVISALANLGLPDITNLITSTADIATAKTVPVAGGGVASMATSTLGALDVLPIGNLLGGPTSVLNQAIQTLDAHGATLTAVTPTTKLLSVQGITASADASVGPGGAWHGTAGLQKVYVLGQLIDLDGLASSHGLGMGQEWNHVFTFPGLGANGGAGSITLDITRGLPQVVADTPTYREVHMAALDVRLINGAAGCPAGSQTCTDPLSGTNAANSPQTAGTSTGIAQFGSDGDMVHVAAPIANAAAAMGPLTPCTVNCTQQQQQQQQTQLAGSQTSLPSTGMFGGGALPAGLLLIAVAISLRLVPSLRYHLRRVR